MYSENCEGSARARRARAELGQGGAARAEGTTWAHLGTTWGAPGRDLGAPGRDLTGKAIAKRREKAAELRAANNLRCTT